LYLFAQAAEQISAHLFNYGANMVQKKIFLALFYRGKISLNFPTSHGVKLGRLELSQKYNF